ncbi:hypothetical protein M4D79_05915 [Mycolicibacterium novocastrense]|nr:hypothetical protein M4D79_05915 [Mycolicibacterium novocastrense]
MRTFLRNWGWVFSATSYGFSVDPNDVRHHAGGRRRGKHRPNEPVAYSISTPAVDESLQLQPARGIDPALLSDPTIYRFQEALAVYGPAIKELIDEEFGDGIMSAINFKVDVQRREDPDGDRVVVTFDGVFLDYRW